MKKSHTVVVEKKATHRLTYKVPNSPDKSEAVKRVASGNGLLEKDEVVRWVGGLRVVSCFEIPTNTGKEFVCERVGDRYRMNWRSGDREDFIVTDQPMHGSLIKLLLLEAGYKEVSLTDWVRTGG